MGDEFAQSRHIMRVFFDNSGTNLPNMGDAAMCQVAIRRLRQLWPDAVILVNTNDPTLLQRFCPGTIAVPACAMVTDSNAGVLRHLHRIVPRRFRRFRGRVRKLAQRPRKRFPRPSEMLEFIAALENTDLYVVGGGGDIYDDLAKGTQHFLQKLGMALERGIPTVMLSQGIGHLSDPDLRNMAARLLPKVSLVFLRETFTGPGSLASLGVAPSRVLVTGDDSIELAYEQRRAEQGNGIGINIRVAKYSQVTGEDLRSVRQVILAAAEHFSAPLLPVPIAFNEAESDLTRIQSLLPTDPFPDDQPETPEAVIRQVSRCRLVVTGSYHGAVFALAQGIPAIGLFRSPYYRDKFGGLAKQFGSGCQTVHLEGSNFGERLDRAIEFAWSSAADLRQPLLSAAARQIQAGQEAYQRLSSLR